MIWLPPCTLWHMTVHRKVDTGTHTHILRKKEPSTASMFERTKGLPSILLQASFTSWNQIHSRGLPSSSNIVTTTYDARWVLVTSGEHFLKYMIF